MSHKYMNIIIEYVSMMILSMVGYTPQQPTTFQLVKAQWENSDFQQFKRQPSRLWKKSWRDIDITAGTGSHEAMKIN